MKTKILMNLKMLWTNILITKFKCKILKSIHKTHNRTNHTTQAQKPQKTPEVIQISDHNEEVKVYDKVSVRKLSWKGHVSAGPYSFADVRD